MIHCFDTFEGYPKEDISEKKEETNRRNQAGDGSDYESVKNFLSIHSNIKMYKGRIQDTANSVDDLQFSFVHIDVNLYAPTLFALNFFHMHMVNGGIIVLDDYGTRTVPA